MRPVNGFFLYRLGSLQYLFSVGDGVVAQEFMGIFVPAAWVLQRHVSDENNRRYMPQSTAVANDLLGYVTAIIEQPTRLLDRITVEGIRGRLNRFQSLLEDELGRLRVYQLEKKRTHEVQDLDDMVCPPRSGAKMS